MLLGILMLVARPKQVLNVQDKRGAIVYMTAGDPMR